MSPEQASVGIIGVEIGVGVAVVGTMGFSPPEAGSLYGTSSTEE